MRDYRGPVPGDIVLLNSLGRDAKKNKIAQYAGSGLKANYTHVAICLGLTTCIHADGKLVDVIATQDMFNDYSGAWRAIRHREIDKMGREEPMLVIRSAQYFLGMAYVRRTIDFVNSTALERETFCSLLIKRIYHELGVDILEGHEKPFPVHFQALVEDYPAIWRDASDEHRIGATILVSHPELKRQALEACRVVRRTREIILENDAFHALMVKYQLTMKQLDERLGVADTLPVDISDPEPPMDYWDRKHKERTKD